MKSNSKVIGVVVCIVCCIGALCILPLVTTNESDLTGWNPSSVYDGVISPSTSVFTDAVLEESNGGGMATAPRVSSTGSRMFHHTGASSVSMSAGATTSSYAGAPVHTTSSAMMGGTGSSISPISTSTARSSMGGASNGGGAIYATSSSTSSRSNAGGSIMSTGGSVSTAPTASRAMSPVMSASSATSGNPSAMYASNMSSNYGSASYGGYSGRRGISGAMRAPGTIGGGTSGNDVYAWYNAWLHDLVEHEGTGWLYGKEIGYFSEEGLKQAWEEAMAALKAEGAMPTWWDESYDWDHFWNWFIAYGGENSYSESYANEFYRLPLPDGVGVLLVLSLLCALFTFLRSRDKQLAPSDSPEGGEKL